MAFTVLAVAFLLTAASVRAQEPIVGAVTGGPSSVVPGAATAYNLTISGGPTGHVDYTVQWYITGSDVTGGLPTSSSPTSTSSNKTTYKLNVTAPTKEQTITLVVKISSYTGSTYENTSVEKSIVVVAAIALSGTFRNDGATAAVNVTVRFYVDDVHVGTTTIARIDPGAQVTTTSNYLPVDLQPGTHRVRIGADLDGNGIIDPARGELVVSDLFYRGTTALSTGWTILIGIAIFLPVLLVTIALRRRKRA